MSTAANYLRELRLCLGQNEFYEFDEFDRSSAAGGRSGMWVTRANLVSLVSLLVSILHRAFTRGRARMRALNVLRKVIMKLTKLTRTSTDPDILYLVSPFFGLAFSEQSKRQLDTKNKPRRHKQR